MINKNSSSRHIVGSTAIEATNRNWGDFCSHHYPLSSSSLRKNGGIIPQNLTSDVTTINKSTKTQQYAGKDELQENAFASIQNYLRDLDNEQEDEYSEEEDQGQNDGMDSTATTSIRQDVVVVDQVPDGDERYHDDCHYASSQKNSKTGLNISNSTHQYPDQNQYKNHDASILSSRHYQQNGAVESTKRHQSTLSSVISPGNDGKSTKLSSTTRSSSQLKGIHHIETIDHNIESLPELHSSKIKRYQIRTTPISSSYRNRSTVDDGSSQGPSNWGTITNTSWCKRKRNSNEQTQVQDSIRSKNTSSMHHFTTPTKSCIDNNKTHDNIQNNKKRMKQLSEATKKTHTPTSIILSRRRKGKHDNHRNSSNSMSISFHGKQISTASDANLMTTSSRTNVNVLSHGNNALRSHHGFGGGFMAHPNHHNHSKPKSITIASTTNDSAIPGSISTTNTSNATSHHPTSLSPSTHSFQRQQQNKRLHNNHNSSSHFKSPSQRKKRRTCHDGMFIKMLKSIRGCTEADRVRLQCGSLLQQHSQQKQSRRRTVDVNDPRHHAKTVMDITILMKQSDGALGNVPGQMYQPSSNACTFLGCIHYFTSQISNYSFGCSKYPNQNQIIKNPKSANGTNFHHIGKESSQPTTSLPSHSYAWITFCDDTIRDNGITHQTQLRLYNAQLLSSPCTPNSFPFVICTRLCEILSS